MNLTEREAQQLHYEVMGIALAIRGHEGESSLYRELDRAIAGLDWRRMAIIQFAFEMLTTNQRSAILSEQATTDEVVRAIAIFGRHLRSMLPGAAGRSA